MGPHNLTQRIAANRAACQTMATDALHGLALDDALSLIETHLDARPGIDGAKLEAFADRIRRQAWERQRGRG